MCAIVGWLGYPPEDYWKKALLSGSDRGRDGWGYWTGKHRHVSDNDPTSPFYHSAIPLETVEHRHSVDLFTEEDLTMIQDLGLSPAFVANFRAAPVTEAETKQEWLQPYSGIVHNGTIANDKEWGDYPIDSMILPLALLRPARPENIEEVFYRITRLLGSYAIAFFQPEGLYLATNYKPIHFYTDWTNYFLFSSVRTGLPGYFQTIQPYTVNRVFLRGKNYIRRPGVELNAPWVKGIGGRYEKSPLMMETINLPRKQGSGVLVAASAGADSTTVAYNLKQKGFDVKLVHFQYGCLAEKRELARIKEIAEHGDFDYEVVQLPFKLKGTLTEGRYQSEGVAGAEYAHDWVAARNLVMLSILTGMAESEGRGYIAFGGNLEESGSFPDNEQEFGDRFNDLLPYSTQNGVKIQLLQPVATLVKHEIYTMGTLAGVPWELTWSCYDNGEHPCGTCGPCTQRALGFQRIDMEDPLNVRRDNGPAT